MNFYPENKSLLRLHFFPCALSVGVKGRDRSRKENTHASKRKTSRRKKFVSCDARLVKNITFVAVDNFEVNLTISGDF